MHLTADVETDAAYLYLRRFRDGEIVARTEPCFLDNVEGQVNMDFDDQGKLIGIEFLKAASVLPESALAEADSGGTEI